MKSEIELREAATALVTKLRAIHEDETYKAVWTLSHLRNGPYTGPNYAAELGALEALLATPNRTGGVGAEPAGEIPALLDRYWDLAYAEGKEGRDHDTPNGDAQETRTKLNLAFIAGMSASPASPPVGDEWRVKPLEWLPYLHSQRASAAGLGAYFVGLTTNRATDEKQWYWRLDDGFLNFVGSEDDAKAAAQEICIHRRRSPRHRSSGDHQMIRLLQLLIFGHVHKWEIIKEGPLKLYDDEIGVGEPIVTTRYIQQCEHCGKLKSYNPVNGYTS